MSVLLNVVGFLVVALILQLFGGLTRLNNFLEKHFQKVLSAKNYYLATVIIAIVIQVLCMLRRI
ncbi:hypothetical protein PMX22_10115 [Clostridium butyricum]|uniref:hypothetical protein n=1 Tax=Clostridium butyricum TaxID=1492 RepID=UPI00232D9B07|nr:hypothetical protein [Clostridium butyricum]MDB2160156.1 hypothetical protein [Clostridium butyricum]